MSSRPTSTNSVKISPSTSELKTSFYLDNDSSNLSSNEAETVQRIKKKKSYRDSGDRKPIFDMIKPSHIQNNVQQQMDETDDFFLCMSKSLKKLPKMDQARIKMDLYKAIHDVEIRQLERENQCYNTK